MKCHDYLTLLQSRLDGSALPLSPDCENHLSQCSSCRALRHSGEILLTGMKLLPAPVVPTDFPQRMAALVLRDRLARRHRQRVWMLVTAALAASLLVMVLAANFLLPVSRRGVTSNDSITKENKQRKGTAPDAVAAPRLAQSVDEARHAFASLSERWTENAQKQTKLLLPTQPIQIARLEGEAGSAFELEPAAKSLQQAGKAVADNLQPVAATARRALAYFARELPWLDKKTVVN